MNFHKLKNIFLKNFKKISMSFLFFYQELLFFNYQFLSEKFQNYFEISN